MEQLNNLDVVFLIIVGISALVGIARGMTKEVLSVTGWILAAVSVIYLTPIVDPIMQKYISSKMLCSFVSGFIILIVFCVFWVLTADKLSSTIRSSKLSALDRIFGFLFGMARGILIVILITLMITTLIPEESKKGVFAESQYFNIAEKSSEPLKSIIPQSWIDNLKEKSEVLAFNGTENKDKKDENTNKVENTIKEDAENNKASDGENKDAAEGNKIKQLGDVVDNIKMLKKTGEDLFNELAQPKPAAEQGDNNAAPSDLDRLLDVLEDRIVVTDENNTASSKTEDRTIEVKESVAETVD